MSHLDRLLVSQSWIKIFPNFHLMSLLRIRSNHNPLLLKFEDHKKRRIPSIFENMWLDHLELEDKIREWWNVIVHGIRIFSLTKKLQHVKLQLRTWNKVMFNKVQDDKAQFKE